MVALDDSRASADSAWTTNCPISTAVVRAVSGAMAATIRAEFTGCSALHAGLENGYSWSQLQLTTLVRMSQHFVIWLPPRALDLLCECVELIREREEDWTDRVEGHQDRSEWTSLVMRQVIWRQARREANGLARGEPDPRECNPLGLGAPPLFPLLSAPWLRLLYKRLTEVRDDLNAFEFAPEREIAAALHEYKNPTKHGGYKKRLLEQVRPILERVLRGRSAGRGLGCPDLFVNTSSDGWKLGMRAVATGVVRTQLMARHRDANIVNGQCTDKGKKANVTSFTTGHVSTAQEIRGAGFGVHRPAMKDLRCGVVAQWDAEVEAAARQLEQEQEGDVMMEMEEEGGNQDARTMHATITFAQDLVNLAQVALRSDERGAKARCAYKRSGGEDIPVVSSGSGSGVRRARDEQHQPRGRHRRRAGPRGRQVEMMMFDSEDEDHLAEPRNRPMLDPFYDVSSEEQRVRPPWSVVVKIPTEMFEFFYVDPEL